MGIFSRGKNTLCDKQLPSEKGGGLILRVGLYFQKVTVIAEAYELLIYSRQQEALKEQTFSCHLSLVLLS